MEENRLKQRLVGATVLVALGVIFIPMFLSGEQSSALLSTNVPPPPAELSDLEPIDLSALPKDAAPMPARPLPIEEERAVEPAHPPPPPAESVSETAPETPPAPQEPASAAHKDSTAEGAPAKAWVVQLASFSRESNALGLRDKLLAGNHHAFVETVDRGENTVYRVRVGPEVRRDTAERLRERLLKETDLEGLVMPHP